MRRVATSPASLRSCHLQSLHKRLVRKQPHRDKHKTKCLLLFCKFDFIGNILYLLYISTLHVWSLYCNSLVDQAELLFCLSHCVLWGVDRRSTTSSDTKSWLVTWSHKYGYIVWLTCTVIQVSWSWLGDQTFCLWVNNFSHWLQPTSVYTILFCQPRFTSIRTLLKCGSVYYCVYKSTLRAKGS
jgi:hypothetical protein